MLFIVGFVGLIILCIWVEYIYIYIVFGPIISITHLFLPTKTLSMPIRVSSLGAERRCWLSSVELVYWEARVSYRFDYIEVTRSGYYFGHGLVAVI